MMRTIEVDLPMRPPDFATAHRLALEIAHANQMESPMVVSWHARADHAVSPHFEGGHPEDWWRKFGHGNQGELEVDIAHAYEFILTDGRDCETLDEIPLRDLTGLDGTPYVCYASLLAGSDMPDGQACMPADEWLCKQT
jgi:hypothetical protein